MQRRYNSNPTFLDFIQITALGFITLFLIAFMLINPIAETGKIDPVTQLMATITWDEESTSDIDIWVKGPNGTKVGYRQKDGNYIILDRDDLGSNNDTYMVDGRLQTVKRNMETITINDIVPGEYVLNVHFFGGTGKNRGSVETVRIDLMDMHPFKVAYTTEINISYRQEVTILSFIVNEKGNITDMRTDVNIPLYNGASAH